MKAKKNIKYTETDLKDQIDKNFDELIKMPQISEALNLLNKLPINLKYHNKDHTLDVLKETILFCLADNQSMDTIEHQVISAAWHDVGYIESNKNNEPIAVKLFEQSNIYKKLSNEYRKEITDSILDTQTIMVNNTPSLLQKRSRFGYMLDADVSNFGRDDFREKLLLVAQEGNIDLNNLEAKRKFYKFVIELLKNHEWKTESAKRLRQQQKEINLKLLEEEYLKL